MNVLITLAGLVAFAKMEDWTVHAHKVFKDKHVPKVRSYMENKQSASVTRKNNFKMIVSVIVPNIWKMGVIGRVLMPLKNGCSKY